MASPRLLTAVAPIFRRVRNHAWRYAATAQAPACRGMALPLYAHTSVGHHRSFFSSPPDDKKYTETHGWMKVEDDGTGVVGITGFGQSMAGTVVACKLPAVGAHFSAGASMVELETMGLVPNMSKKPKMSSPGRTCDVHALVDCEIIEVNTLLAEDPELVNNGAEDDGWLVRVKITGDISTL